MDFDIWMKTYLPIRDETDPLLLRRYEPKTPDHQVLAGVPHCKVWTVVEDDGEEVIQPGVKLANRLYFVVTAKPWTDPEMTIVRYDDTDENSDEYQWALKWVASRLALSSFEHLESVKELPNLKENAAEAMAKNLRAANALGIAHMYQALLRTVTGGNE